MCVHGKLVLSCDPRQRQDPSETHLGLKLGSHFLTSNRGHLGSLYKVMGEMAPLRPTGYVDPGWDYGTAQDAMKKKVKCNYMPYIYNDMYKAKLAIRNLHEDDVQKCSLFWSSLFHHPICLAAYFLNPAYRYRPNTEVTRGLNDCIVRLEPDSETRVSASMQISDFVSAKADFGTELAISTRTELDPAVWWQQHGVNCLELQRIAVRILSQACSSFGCEHNWSIHDQTHFQGQNRLAQRKVDDLVYAHYNFRLRERQIRPSNELISLDSVLLEGLLDDWIVETEKAAMQDNEDIFDHEDGYDYDMLDYDNGVSDTRGSLEMVTLAEVEPLEVHPSSCPTDDHHDLDFLGDSLSD